MTQELIASFAEEVAGAPEWIMFAPAGNQVIQAKLDGKPSKVRILVDEAAAQSLQRDLEARKADGGPQPFFDLHHDAREAAAYPEEFQWREDGIWCRVKWTPTGLEATKCDLPNGVLPSVRYFSPRCAVSRGRIVGLLDSSAGNAAGGLVSDPAFERIAPLVASKQTPDDTMDKKRLMKALGRPEEEEMDDEALMVELEAACGAYKSGKKMEAEMAPKMEEIKAAKAQLDSEVSTLKSELEAARKQLADAKAGEADGFVRELVASGKIPAKAEGLKSVWRNQYLADSAAALEASKELQAPVLDRRLTTDDSKPAVTAENKGALREHKAKELLASKQANSYEAAWESACALIP